VFVEEEGGAEAAADYAHAEFAILGGDGEERGGEEGAAGHGVYRIAGGVEMGGCGGWGCFLGVEKWP
jgi:hypothetical protein